MCSECAKEYAAVSLPENHEQIVASMQAIYDHPDGTTGGPLHIVLDDYNVDSVEWCEERLNQIGTDEEASWLRDLDPDLIAAARRCVLLLKPLTEAERGACIAKFRGEDTVDEPDREVLP